MQEKWNFLLPDPNPGVPLRMAVFHHAGGSSLSFLRLAKALRGEAEVFLAELPGRGTRLNEDPAESLVAFARECASQLARDPRPLLLYGHSMGALVAYEAALALEASGCQPGQVVVSACRAPGATHGPRNIPLSAVDLLSEEALFALQRAYGPYGPDPQSPLVKAYFLTVLRSDIRLIARYLPSGGALRAPLAVLGGECDPVVLPEDLSEWASYTLADFIKDVYPGGHFFPLEGNLKMLADFFRDRLGRI